MRQPILKVPLTSVDADRGLAPGMKKSCSRDLKSFLTQRRSESSACTYLTLGPLPGVYQACAARASPSRWVCTCQHILEKRSQSLHAFRQSPSLERDFVIQAHVKLHQSIHGLVEEFTFAFEGLLTCRWGRQSRPTTMNALN